MLKAWWVIRVLLQIIYFWFRLNSLLLFLIGTQCSIVFAFFRQINFHFSPRKCSSWCRVFVQSVHYHFLLFHAVYHSTIFSWWTTRTRLFKCRPKIIVIIDAECRHVLPPLSTAGDDRRKMLRRVGRRPVDRALTPPFARTTTISFSGSSSYS